MTGYLGIIGAALMLYAMTSNLWVVGLYLVIAEVVFTWTKIRQMREANEMLEKEMKLLEDDLKQRLDKLVKQEEEKEVKKTKKAKLTLIEPRTNNVVEKEKLKKLDDLLKEQRDK